VCHTIHTHTYHRAIHPTIHPSIQQPTHPSVHPSIHPPQPNITTPTVTARLQRLAQNPPPALARIFSPPIIGCVSGLLLGISPFAKYFLGGKDAPLAVLTNSVDTLGKAYASSALLVLAGSLALPTPPAPAAALASDTAGPAKERTISGPLQVASICLVRFFLCPLIFLTIVLKAMSRCVCVVGLVGGSVGGWVRALVHEVNIRMGQWRACVLV
jgi:hypothetical protein